MERTIIGIAGGTASGKTTLADVLLTQSGEGNAVIVRLDNYYRHRSDLSLPKRASLNYDHPDAFDVPLILQHIKALKAGKSIAQPTYDFVNHLRAKQTTLTPSAPVIIVEGILTFAIPALLALLDFKIYVDTPADIRVLRRVQRDIEERGRTFGSVTTQYMKTVRPMHDLFVEPSKVHADVIVPEGAYNPKATDLLLTKVASMVSEFNRKSEKKN
ncbi:MAG: uridine kinase [Bacilli bacterium]